MSAENPAKPRKLTEEQLPAYEKHAEAMHIHAQEENGIENPSSLRDDLKAEEQEKLADVKERLKEHAETAAVIEPKESAPAGGSHGHVGHGVDKNSIETWKVLGPVGVASGVGLAALLTKPAAVIAWIMKDIFGINSISELWSEGKAALGKMIGGGGGGGAKPKKSSGGGGHAPSGGGHH